MDRKGAQPPADRRIAALAARQHGVVQRAQLQRLGVGDGAIERRAGRGQLHRVHRGVYAVGHRLLTREGRFMAVVLACGEGVVLSHVSAAVLWGLLRKDGPHVHVTAPSRSGRKRRQGIVVHRAGLDEAEVTTLAGIPVTTPGRTIVDLADVVTRRTVERAIARRITSSSTAPACDRGRAGREAASSPACFPSTGWDRP
jgi:predicted transcriptional regulator of viral defense system